MRFLLGPLLFVMDVAPENQVWGIALCLALLPGLLTVLFRPRWWSALLFVVTALAWIFLGEVGLGLGC
jgi:hypothetical protein